MKIGITLNLEEALREQQKTLSNAQKAILGGVQEATTEAKTGLRDMTRGAFKGNRLPNTWQSKLYGPKSFNPAGMVFSKAPLLMKAFSEGTTIRSKFGSFLAIPTEYVQRREGRKLTPADFEEAGIPLRYIPPQGSRRVGLLVVDNFRVTKKGKARVASDRALKTGKGVTTIVMFILVKTTTLEKRIDPLAVIKRVGDGLPQRITDKLKGGKE